MSGVGSVAMNFDPNSKNRDIGFTPVYSGTNQKYNLSGLILDIAA
jgi:hypothetical protein